MFSPSLKVEYVKKEVKQMDREEIRAMVASMDEATEIAFLEEIIQKRVDRQKGRQR